MDISQHGEEAYADGEGAVLVLHDDSEGPLPHIHPHPVFAAEAGVA